MNVIMSTTMKNEQQQQEEEQEEMIDSTATTGEGGGRGIAGRTNYANWDKVATTLIKEVEQQDQEETAIEKAKLGLDGKYAMSQAEADERMKLKQVKKTKRTLEKFKKRETAVMQEFANLLGPVKVVKQDNDDNDDDDSNSNNNNNDDTNRKKIEESKSIEHGSTGTAGSGSKIVRITRDIVDAGKRVVCICDTSGLSMDTDTIVLTQDLSHLESKMAPNAMTKPKHYPEDAENQPQLLPTATKVDAVATPASSETTTTTNTVEEGKSNTDDVAVADVVDVAVAENSNKTEQEQYRKILGIIKLFISNVHNCTILVKCKLITGTIEMHNCSNIKIKIEHTATVATIQADLSENITVEFWDAPSGRNNPSDSKTLYWGDDKNDRIFHAGTKNMKISLYRDGYLDNTITCDYIRDGAESIGNATLEEYQFITSCYNGQLITEKVARTTGTTTGKNARAMTERELQEEKEKRNRAAKCAIKMAEDMIQIKDKDGNVLVTKQEQQLTPTEPTLIEPKTSSTTTLQPATNDNDEEIIEEIYTSMNKEQIQDIINECDELKKRGNEAFGAGEYGQAILHYTLAYDKSMELPDKDNGISVQKDDNDDNNDTKKSLFPRDVILSNRSACFLKLGQHEKAEQDAIHALRYNPNNIKANFRLGLAFHAQHKYSDALPKLAYAHKIEPNNKQIKQALQFCEVRLEQERRKLMEH